MTRADRSRRPGPRAATVVSSSVPFTRPDRWLAPVLLVDGRIAGVWGHEREGGWLRVTISPFAAVKKFVRAGAEREAQRLAEYFGDELELAWE